MKKILHFFALLVGLLSFGTSWATKFEVTTNGASNAWYNKCVTTLPSWVTITPGSFQEAIYKANAGQADTIVFAPNLAGQTINLGAAPENSITLCANNIVVDGKDAPGMILQGINNGPALIVTGDNATIKNLQFTTNSEFRGGLEYQTNNSFVDSCTFLDGNLFIGHIQLPSVYVTGNQITNCDIQQGNIQIMGADNTVDNCSILGQLLIGYEGIGTVAPVLSNTNIITNCTGMAQGSIIYGNGNEIINANMTVTSVPSNKPHGVTIKGNANKIINSSLSNTLSVNQTNDYSGIRIEDPLSFDNIIDSTTIDGWWNGVYIRDAENNTISNNNIINSQNAGVLIDANGNNNIITSNIIDGSIKNGVQLNSNEGNVFSKNEVKNSEQANGFSLISTTGKNTITENSIFGNIGNGIYLYGALDTEVTNNFIGQNADGSVVDGNQVGMTISNYSSGSIIDGNTIVASLANGIQIGEFTAWNDAKTSGNNSTIINNIFGNANNSNAALENAGNAILIQNGSTGNIIGKPNEGNTITNRASTSPVIVVDGTVDDNGQTSTGNTIQGNILSCNAGKGIDLLNDGNENYASTGTSPNWVTINTAEPAENTISGKFQTATGNVTIDIYVSGDCQTRCSTDETGTTTPNEIAQGKTWVASVSVPGADGEWSYTFEQAAIDAGITKDNAIVTATDAGGNTSEFSVCEFDPPCTNPTDVSLVAEDDATSVCEGETITLNTVVSPLEPGYVFEWYKYNATTDDYDLVTGETGTSLLIDEQSKNGTYKFFVYHLDRNLCGKESDNTLEVAINTNPDSPEFTNTTPEFCSGTGEEVISVTNVEGITYNWTAANIVSGNGTNEVTIDFSTATNPTEIKVIATDATTNCSSEEVALNVTINDKPTPEITGESAPLCEEEGVVYTVSNANDGSTYTWTVPNGANFTENENGSEITVNFSDNNGDIIVTEENIEGCTGTSEAFAISLKSCGLKADFTDDNDGVICLDASLQNNEITFTDKSTGDIVDWAWNFGTDATPATTGGQGPHVVSYSSIGTKTIQLIITDSEGTSDTASYEITVNDIPNADDFNLEVAGGCEGEEGTFEVTGNNDVDLAVYDYSWTIESDGIDNGQGTTAVTTTLQNSGTASVKIADQTTTCQIELNSAYGVTQKPNTDINISGEFEICDGASQDSYFDNDSTYFFELVTSTGDPIGNLSSIHPEIDSVFITWTLTDKNGNKTNLSDQSGLFSAGTNKSVSATINPGFITGDDDDGNEIEEQNYTLSVSIEKRGACGVDSTVIDQELLTINKSHKYVYSIASRTRVCDEDTISFEAELAIDDVAIDPYTDYTTYPTNFDAFNYYHNWYYIDNNENTSPIEDTVYKVVEKNPVNGTEPAIHYYTTSNVLNIPTNTFEITDTIPRLWNLLATQDTLFRIKEKAPLAGVPAVITYIATANDLTDDYAITDTILKSRTTLPFNAYKGDSILLLVDHDHLCYTQPSVFADTITEYTLDRPGGIIALGSESTGLPDTVDLVLKDVEDVILQNVNANSSLVDHQWSWGIVEGNDTTFSTESILDPLAATTTHTPLAIEAVIYKLVTDNGSCKDSAYANMTNLLHPFVPNTISPNEDGVFDELIIHNSENYPEMTVQIFNRWGTLVWESEKGYPTPWAGTRNDGSELPVGTYFYIINFNDEAIDALIEAFDEENDYPTARGGESLQAGSITIMR
ncbi:MAG: T9SS type B sorting domain-containing protein [Cytophagales bacterium]|nr:T9SS type B sorting domain-containing protein [Cytophagales bacterium]